MVEVSTGAIRRMTNDEAYDIPLGWTDDGSAILVASNRGDLGREGDVWEVDIENGDLTRRPNAGHAPSTVLRSPDGRWDVFLSPRSRLLLGRAGAGSGQRIGHADFRSGAAWSPDGAWLIWTERIRARQDDLFLMRVPDGEPRRLTETESDETTPVWGPSRASFP